MNGLLNHFVAEIGNNSGALRNRTAGLHWAPRDVGWEGDGAVALRLVRAKSSSSGGGGGVLAARAFLACQSHDLFRLVRRKVIEDNNLSAVEDGHLRPFRLYRGRLVQTVTQVEPTLIRIQTNIPFYFSSKFPIQKKKEKKKGALKPRTS